MQYQEATLRHLSPAAFGMLGSMDMAYIRAAEENGAVIYRIFAANGQQLGEEKSADAALVVARQNDFEAFLVN
ncbi:DUF1150 domain-containing protein [Sneathiella litorea]|uniref:DUF1150 domain-containing protein n=1 Tax=Sneathiella litorea TaxID=2606216 RepID=A0A6L8W381_9PROT|nr:DUF1150 domain-containing protein [Sneathiella litorea]MZR29555.1 DUF1150 domain-containing protein [Sneathiella litorea]